MSIKKLSLILLALIFSTNSISVNQDIIRVDKKIYISYYSQRLKNPIAVEYSLYHFKGDTTITRKGLDFYTEKGITTASSKDFIGNKWDKGHMASAQSFSDSKENIKSTFSYVNCAVQHFGLNRGVWAKLEGLERKWSKNDSLIISVKIEFDDPVKKLPTGTAIPKSFTKKIKFFYSGKTLAYLFPNNACKKPLTYYQINN